MFYFHFNSMKLISLTRTMSLAKNKCNSATQQKVCLVVNGFFSLWKNPDPTDAHGKMPISFSRARISPACIHRRKTEKKQKLVQLILVQLKWSFLGHSVWRPIRLYLLWWAKCKRGKKVAPYQMVIFHNSFLGGGKLGLNQKSYFTFPRHIREQSLLCSITFLRG